MINTLKRREQIIDQLCRQGTVRVEALSAQFNVSTVTIRNDLRHLEKSGCAIRGYGGARLNKQFVFDRPLEDKGRINRDVKTAIACAAAALVNDGDTIILDSGSTTSLMTGPLQAKRGLVVMTNAHSTDYQSPQAYRELVCDHFAILKVGPALTYALREALFALDHIEREWRGEHRAAHLCATLEQVMGDHPAYWQRYYPGTPQQQQLHRRYSLSDRVRYYWPRPEVVQAVERLLDNLRAHPAPMTLLSQYLPSQARAMAAGQLSADPLDWVMHKIGEVLADYADACQPSSRSPNHD